MEAHKSWELDLIEDAIEQFWNEFFPLRIVLGPKLADLRQFALKRADKSPPKFISDFIERLDQIGWSRVMDTGYKRSRTIMHRIALSSADPDEYICSVFALEKLLKRKKDKICKKIKAETAAENATQDLSPPWELDLIEEAIENFWNQFFPERIVLGPILADFREFSLKHTDKFPLKYVSDLIKRLDQIGWSRIMDTGYKMPRTMMNRLASSVAKVAELDIYYLSFITALETKVEAERKREEARLRQQQKDEAERAKREKEREEKDKRNKDAKERKNRAKVRNQMARVGAKALGLSKS